MAFIRTLRHSSRSRPSGGLSGSLACAAARPLMLSTSVRRAGPILLASGLRLAQTEVPRKNGVTPSATE